MAGCSKSTGTGSFGMRFRGVSPGLLWIPQYGNVGWQEPAGLELPSCPAGFPDLGSLPSLLIGWRKLGSISQLENSEFGSQVPQNFHPVAPGQLLQGDEMQLELIKGTSLVGGTCRVTRCL